MLSLTGCNLMGGGGNGSGEYVDKWVNLVNETRYDAVVNGNTITYGDHTYTIVSDIDVDTKEYKKATASVTFSNIPSGFTEFEAVYNGLLGKSVAGTVAMIPMAMEICCATVPLRSRESSGNSRTRSSPPIILRRMTSTSSASFRRPC